MAGLRHGKEHCLLKTRCQVDQGMNEDQPLRRGSQPVGEHPQRFRATVPKGSLKVMGTGHPQRCLEGRALRTETTINDTRDFAIGRRLKNLPDLRRVGFDANRRLLDVRLLSHDATLGEDEFHRVVSPTEVDGQHASALRFEDSRVQALMACTLLFVPPLPGFSSKDLHEPLAGLLGLAPEHLTAGRMTYDLRRLRLHGLIERIPKTHRYRLTQTGLHVAIFFNRVYARLLRPGLAALSPQAPPTPISTAFHRLQREIDRKRQGNPTLFRYAKSR